MEGGTSPDITEPEGGMYAPFPALPIRVRRKDTGRRGTRPNREIRPYRIPLLQSPYTAKELLHKRHLCSSPTESRFGFHFSSI